MGRLRSSRVEAEWRSRLARYRESGLTVVEFCRRESVSAPSFYQWKKRLAGPRSSADGRQSAGESVSCSGGTGPFVAVHLAAAAMAEVEFPNGVRIRVPATDTEALRAAVRAGCDHCSEAGSC